MYFKELIADITVASIVPTRESCVAQALSDLPLGKAEVIVEYGPGSGAFTRQLLNRARPSCRIIAVESNRNFAEALPGRMNDRRLDVVYGDAGDIASILSERGIEAVDQVISGIPFSLINRDTKQRICADTARYLRGDGRFLVYQAQLFPGARRAVERTLRPWFKIVESKELFLNLPPLYVLEAEVRQDLAELTL